MGNFLRLVNGVPRHFSEASTITIYDQGIDVVSGSPGSNQITGPVAAGTPITLPSGQTYTGGELEVMLNGDILETVLDYSYVGSGSKTQIQLTFDLVVGDRLRFRITRAP